MAVILCSTIVLIWLNILARQKDINPNIGRGAIFVMVLAVGAQKGWQKIKAAEPGETHTRKHRVFRNSWLGALLVMLTLTGVFGFSIAQKQQQHLERQRAIAQLQERAAELQTRKADIAPKLAGLLGANPDNLSAYIKRCHAMGPLLQQYESMRPESDKLLGNVDQLLGDDATVHKYVSTIRAINDKDSETMKNVSRELALESQMEQLPPERELQFYRDQIQPVRDEGLRLRRDEAAMVRSALDSGMKMPDYVTRIFQPPPQRNQ